MTMFRGVLASLAMLFVACAPVGGAEPAPDSSPQYDVFPYNWYQNRVTPDQVTAMRESCQWFNASTTD